MTVVPTEYDLAQDQKIDAHEAVLAKAAQPPSGPEFSYPVVGQAMSDSMWQWVTLGTGSGVLDAGGRPYWLRLNGTEQNTNATRTMLLTVSTTQDTANAVLRGFFHQLSQDMTISLPMPLTGPVTYRVCLTYDPRRSKDPGGPIRVNVLDREPPSDHGQFHLVLWEVDCQPSQLLTDATIRRVRPKIAPTISVDRREDLPDPSTVLWGTTAMLTQAREQPGEILRAGGTGDESGPTRWISITSPDWVESTSNAYPWAGHGMRPAWRLIGDRVEIRGRIKRQNNSPFYNGNSYQFIAGNPPASQERAVKFFAGFTQGDGLVVFDSIPPDPGQSNVVLIPSRNANWIDLTGIFYYTR